MWKSLIIMLCVAFTTSLCAEINVLALAGSTRDDSLNKKLIVEAADLASQMGANVIVIDLKDYPIPFCDSDLIDNEGVPANALELRKLMIQSQAILIASPEFNASIPAILKNFLDWVSVDEEGNASRAAYKEKKFGIMSASPGKEGGIKGLDHLRDIIEDVGGTVIPEQVAVPSAYNAFDEEGKLKDPQLISQLQELVQKTME